MRSPGSFYFEKIFKFEKILVVYKFFKSKQHKTVTKYMINKNNYT